MDQPTPRRVLIGAHTGVQFDMFVRNQRDALKDCRVTRLDRNLEMIRGLEGATILILEGFRISDDARASTFWRNHVLLVTENYVLGRKIFRLPAASQGCGSYVSTDYLEALEKAMQGVDMETWVEKFFGQKA